MAVRTTAAEVKLILDDTSLSDGIIDSFITSANLFVTNALASTSLGATTLADIERWITAHLVSYTRDRQAKKEEAGSAKIEYTGNFNGKGLLGTSYGQMAVSLDTTGTLEEISGGTKSISIQAM